MNRQKRSYARIDNEDNISNNGNDDFLAKRQQKCDINSSGSSSSGSSSNSSGSSGSSNRPFVGANNNQKNNALSSNEMSIPYCLLLPNRAIGFVIGKSGNNIREIEKECGAIIKCQKDFDISTYPPPSEKILTIFGKKENKKKALELVLDKSKSVMDFREEDGKESIVIIVPTRSIPIIIGQKGSKISFLCEKSSCEINVHKNDVPGIKDKAIFIKSKKINKIIDCIGIIYDLLEDIVENGILCLSEFPGVSKNVISKSSSTLATPLNNNHNFRNANNSVGNYSGGNYNYNNSNSNYNNANHIDSSIHNYNNSSKYSSMKKVENSNFEIDNCNVPKENNLLLHKYGKEISSCVIRFVLDVETTAWIIGKSGCHIKEIRSVTGAGAVIVDAPDNIENVKRCDRILTLSGSPENKYNALKLIVRQMEERDKNINSPMRMLVPGKAASFLIGRKGSIIKYITEQSGSQIQVAKNKDSENEKLVLISGSPESKILASILVLQKLEEYENPAIIRESLLIPLNGICLNSNNKKSNTITANHNNNSSINSMYNKGSTNENNRYYSNSLLHNNYVDNNGNNIHGNIHDVNSNNANSNHHRDTNYRNSARHGNNSHGYNDAGSTNYQYDHMINKINNNSLNNINNNVNSNNNNSNSSKHANDIKDKIEQMFLQQVYNLFPLSSLPKILSIKQPYTIELNMPNAYLETFDSQNKNNKSLIEEIIEKSGCNISICTDYNDSSSYTFNLSITGSPLSNSLAILMIQAKIFQFDWF